MDVIAGQNLSQGNSDMVMKMLKMQSENQQAALNASVATRGQDINAQSNALNNYTTQRGQDMQSQSYANKTAAESAVAMRGQDMRAQSEKDNLGVQQQQVEINKQIANVKESELKLQTADMMLKEQKRASISHAYQTGGFEGMKAALASAGEYKAALDIQDAQDRLNQNNIANARNDRNDLINNMEKLSSIDKTKADIQNQERQVKEMRLDNWAGQMAGEALNMPDGPAKENKLKEIAIKYNEQAGYDAINVDNPKIGLMMASNRAVEAAKGSKNPALIAAAMGPDALKQNNGLSINFDSEGKVSDISLGGSGNKQGMNDSVTGYNKAQEFGDRLQTIKESFKPEQMTWAGKFQYEKIALKDESGLDLSPEEQNYLNNAETFRTNVMQLFNSYRKDITGAAASQQELDRLLDSFLNNKIGPARFNARFNAMAANWQKDVERNSSGIKSGGVARASTFGSGSIQQQAAEEYANRLKNQQNNSSEQ